MPDKIENYSDIDYSIFYRQLIKDGFHLNSSISTALLEQILSQIDSCDVNQKPTESPKE